MSGPEGGTVISRSSGALVLRVDPVPEGSQRVRNFIAEFSESRGLRHIADDAALCATELATNAILHSRQQFVVSVRSVGLGLRLDVLDSNPGQLPMMTPTIGTAIDLTTFGNSGRGLQIVAALAARWGVYATDEAKTVWAEVTGEPGIRSDPVVVLRQSSPEPREVVALHFLDLPVRAAVASGIQVEDVMRDLQLEPKKSVDDDRVVTRLFDLLDRSASIRLAGRHAALQAAAAGATRFDLNVRVTMDALRALGELAPLLNEVHLILSVRIPPLPRDVVEFRTWLNEENARQLTGVAPSPCPLD